MSNGLAAPLGFPLGDDDASLPDEALSGGKIYVTRSGDTWDAIALRTLGAERYMDALLDANPGHNYVARFDAGVVLNVPPLPDPARPAILPRWRAS